MSWKKSLAFLLAYACVMASTSIAGDLSPRVYTIDLSAHQLDYKASPVQAVGMNPRGDRFSINSHYLSFNGQPVLPVTGEFHYYRVPRAYWQEQLQKLKAGGVGVVATYVHWIVHEEREGVFDWRGYRDLRAFVDLCADLDLKVILRVGPFGHGEIRSGGFPDWLMGRPLTVRSNDPEYLRYVSRFFAEIGKQVAGRMFSQGGPIIAVQIENEYQHSASPWGLSYPGQEYDLTAAPTDVDITREGAGNAVGANQHGENGVAHMRRLLELVEGAGLIAPLYTATGWGNATIVPDKTLPVSGGYAYPSWEPAARLSPFYLFTDLHLNPDYKPVSYDPSAYPVLSAEIGPGIMTTYTRRPLVPAQSTDALVNRFLGSGANAIGYYMFQGGSTPRGERVFYSDEAYGYPKISYDFQAPLGEFGDLRPSFHRLKLTHFFLDALGSQLAPLPVVLPAGAKDLKPASVADLRYAARGEDGRGFLFLNNFQDHAKNQDLRIALSVRTKEGEIRIPDSGNFLMPAGESAIFPVNLDLGGATLVYATAQPLTNLSDSNRTRWVFFSLEGIAPEFMFGNATVVSAKRTEGCQTRKRGKGVRVKCGENRISRFEIRSPSATPVEILVLDRRTALDSWVQRLAGAKRLLLTAGAPLVSGDDIDLVSERSNTADLAIYPAVGISPTVSNPASIDVLQPSLGFDRFRITQPVYVPQFQWRWIASNKLLAKLGQQPLPNGIGDLWLRLDYQADTVMVFKDGELVADTFFAGMPWDIGLKKFLNGGGEEFLFYFRPLEATRAYSEDLTAAGVADIAAGQSVIQVRTLTLASEYRARLSFHQTRHRQ